MRTDHDIFSEVTEAMLACGIWDYDQQYYIASIVNRLVELERQGGYTEDTFWNVVEENAK